ncbi:MAG: ComEC/Rec2 family competence protein [Bacteroidales bacterium]
MHILCVSGLHVGIIYVILNNLLLFLNRKRLLRITKVVLLLLLIWTYALITGLSPSVLRASTMFSFIIIGNSMKRKANIYNSLSASAFVLMIFNPFIITQVGFQLSYLAVFGIVMLYKPIVNLFIPGNMVVRWIWQISVVSIAATLATFPLSLFYFHQFPNLFLLTNLVAIPASMLIIYTGILVLIFSPLPILSGLVAKILAGIIWILNFMVNRIEGLTFSVSKNIYINGMEMIIIFGIGISLLIVSLQGKKKYVFPLLVCASLLLISFTYRNYTSLNQKSIVIYNISKTSAIDFISQKSDFLLADSLLTPNKMEYHINNFWTAQKVRNHSRFELMDSIRTSSVFFKLNNFIQFHDKRLILINRDFPVIAFPQKMRVDYIILSGSPFLKIEELNACFVFDKIVFDASNSLWMVNKWKEECKESGIDFYDVKTNGAWRKAL